MPGRWRTLIIEVRPDRLVAFWNPPLDQHGAPATAARPFASLSVAEIRTHRKAHELFLQQVFGPQTGHVFAQLPDWNPQLGIGVWAFQADVAVKNVVVSPSDSQE